MNRLSLLSVLVLVATSFGTSACTLQSSPGPDEEIEIDSTLRVRSADDPDEGGQAPTRPKAPPKPQDDPDEGGQIWEK